MMDGKIKSNERFLFIVMIKDVQKKDK